jgi:hypothetical protein
MMADNARHELVATIEREARWRYEKRLSSGGQYAEY